MRVQLVVMPDGTESWTVLDDCGDPVPPGLPFLHRELLPCCGRLALPPDPSCRLLLPEGSAFLLGHHARPRPLIPGLKRPYPGHQRGELGETIGATPQDR